MASFRKPDLAVLLDNCARQLELISALGSALKDVEKEWGCYPEGSPVHLIWEALADNELITAQYLQEMAAKK